MRHQNMPVWKNFKNIPTKIMKTFTISRGTSQQHRPGLRGLRWGGQTQHVDDFGITCKAGSLPPFPRRAGEQFQQLSQTKPAQKHGSQPLASQPLSFVSRDCTVLKTHQACCLTLLMARVLSVRQKRWTSLQSYRTRRFKMTESYVLFSNTITSPTPLFPNKKIR